MVGAQLLLIFRLVLAGAWHSVTLRIESANRTLDGMFLTGISESDTASALFITNTPQQFLIYPSNTSIAYYFGKKVLTLGTDPDQLMLTSYVPTVLAYVVNGYLVINGTEETFYACQELPFDPKNYTRTYLGVCSRKSNSACQQVRVRAEKNHAGSPSETGYVIASKRTSAGTQSTSQTAVLPLSPAERSAVDGHSTSTTTALTVLSNCAAEAHWSVGLAIAALMFL